MLPGGLSPRIVPEEGGHGDCAKLNQKAENRFGWPQHRLSYSPVPGHDVE